MTALHRGGAGNSPCSEARNDGHRAVCRAGVMMTALVAVASLSVAGYTCVLAVHRQQLRAADSRQLISGISALVSSRALVALSRASKASGSGAAGPITLTVGERRDCPAGAAACVDLTDKVTWLQAGGKVTYGPVSMEPSAAGVRQATPTGTFHLTGEADPGDASHAGHDLIPWATFFAPGGIAFCPGSLTRSTNGCVHLAMAAARFYDRHLPAGAEVVVFLG